MKLIDFQKGSRKRREATYGDGIIELFMFADLSMFEQ